MSPALVSGGFFEADEPLVRIDRRDYEADLESARAGAARAESELAPARARSASASGSWRTARVASESRIDDAENAYRAAEAALREARGRGSIAPSATSSARSCARPIAGRVRSERVDVGQFVSRGAPIATLYAVDYAEVRLPIPDRELAYVDLPLAYRSEAGPKRATETAAADDGSPVRLQAEFAGRAARVDRAHRAHRGRDRSQAAAWSTWWRASTIPTPARRAAIGPPLAVGLFVEAEILGRSVDAAVTLPRAALRRDEAGPGEPPGRAFRARGGRREPARVPSGRGAAQRARAGGDRRRSRPPASGSASRRCAPRWTACWCGSRVNRPAARRRRAARESRP